MPSIRPRLTPAIADVRRAVRAALDVLPLPPALGTAPTGAPGTHRFRNDGDSSAFGADPGAESRNLAESPSFRKGEAGKGEAGKGEAGKGEARKGEARTGEARKAPLVLVALSGGPDSLALAAATAFEAPRAGLRAGAVIVDHGMQTGSADAAAAAARTATELGLTPVLVVRVEVGAAGGPEAAARAARYAALDEAADSAGASAVLLGHTLDDQAETVLLGLARGSGSTSLHAMAAVAGRYRRPLLGIRRSTTVQFCSDSGLIPWLDPLNGDDRFARVRVRRTVLPVLEAELGPGIADALARTAEQLREDDDALDRFAAELLDDLAEHSEAGLALPVAALAVNPPALRQRIIRLAVSLEFDVSLSRAHTLAVAALVTDWHGQSALDLPGVSVERIGTVLAFRARSGG